MLVLVDLAGGGTQRVVSGLATAFLDAGTSVTIVTNRSEDGRWSDVADRARIVQLSGDLRIQAAGEPPSVVRNLRWLLVAIRQIRTTARQTPRRTPLLAFLPGTNVVTALACLGLDRPLVLSERNDITRQPLSLPLRLARRLLYRTADAVTTNRPSDVPDLQRITGRVPVRSVLNPPPFVGGSADPAVSRRVVCVGRLTEHKRHHDIIMGFRQVADEFPEWSLRILGDGPERTRLEEQVRDLRIEARVEFAGWSDDVAGELKQGAIFVHAAEYEGASNAVIEAMAAALPVVTSHSTAPDVAQGCSATAATMIFPTRDVQALAEALRRLMTDAALRTELGHAGRHRVRDLTAEPLQEWMPVVLRACR